MHGVTAINYKLYKAESPWDNIAGIRMVKLQIISAVVGKLTPLIHKTGT